MTRRGQAAVGAAILTAALVAGSLIAIGAPRASAQIGVVRAEPAADRQSWYWERNQRVSVPTTGVQQKLFAAPAQQHHLQLSLERGEEDKRAYVGFDVLFLQDFIGATVRSFNFSVAVSPATSEHANQHLDDAQESQTPPLPPATSGDENARIVACPVTSFVSDGADGDPTHDPEGERIEPEFDCGQGMAEGRRSADGLLWSFDLSGIASMWASGEMMDAAVVLKPAPDPPGPPDPASTWTVELHGRQLDGFEATMVYTPAGVAGAAAEEITAPAPPPAVTTPGEAAPASPLGAESAVETAEPVEAGAPPLAPVRGEPQPQYPWYAVLPWIGGAATVALAFRALREGPRMAAQHRVAELMRSGRAGESKP